MPRRYPRPARPGGLYTTAYQHTYGIEAIVRPFSSDGRRQQAEGASAKVIPTFVMPS